MRPPSPTRPAPTKQPPRRVRVRTSRYRREFLRSLCTPLAYVALVVGMATMASAVSAQDTPPAQTANGADTESTSQEPRADGAIPSGTPEQANAEDAPTTPEAESAPTDATAETSASAVERTSDDSSEGLAAVLEESARRAAPVPWWQRAISFGGIPLMLFIAWLLSSHRRRFPWRIALWGVGIQLTFAVLVLKTGPGLALFRILNDGVVRLLEFTDAGSRFVFGSMMDGGFSIALNVLPTILFFSSLMAVLYHLGLVQKVVSGIAWLMRRTMKTSGAETLSAAANIFVGQTEAPLVVKPYVDKMTLSELNAVMVGGFATVAGGVLAGYVDMLHADFPDIAGHLIAASVLSAPAALVIAKVMLPETETPATYEGTNLSVEKVDANVIDAAARGAGEGLKLALNVGAMLLAFIALVAMVNALLGVPVTLANSWFGTEWDPWTLEGLLGMLFQPLAFAMGVAPEDCATVGSLLGEKLVVTEFVAYGHLAEMLREGAPLQHRSVVIATYALCGFANFGSIAIQIGGIGAIAPERRSDLARLGLRAMIGGTLAACMTATIAGLLA